MLRNLNVLYMETAAFSDVDDDSFVSVFLGIIDPERRVMTYASAGHEPAIFLSSNRAPEMLLPTAPIIGVFAKSQKLFHERMICLPLGGSMLVATTDGVTEARAPQGGFMQTNDILEFVAANRTVSAQEQADRLLFSTKEFCGGSPRASLIY